jgi:hypothetical protein
MSDTLQREAWRITSRGEWLWTCAACGREFRTRRSRPRRFCSVDCSASYLANQWWQVDRDGIKTKIAKRNAARQTPLHDRFNAGYRIDENGCWIWQRGIDGRGYGQISAKIGNLHDKAHRTSYYLHKGEIPDGLLVCHHCDVKACVNPDHLFLGTVKDNSDDAAKKGRLRGGIMKGESNKTSKLKNADVEAIRLSDETLSILAERYGVARQTVWKIRKGHTWKL